MTRYSAPELLLATQLEGAGIPFEREYAFGKVLNPPRRWRADFATAVPMSVSVRTPGRLNPWSLLIEVDGGTWLPAGRHTTGSGFAKDLEKLNAAAELGYRVLRFTPSMIEDGSALAQIQRVLGVEKAA